MSVEYDKLAGVFTIEFEDDFAPITFEMGTEFEQKMTTTALDGDMDVTFTGFVEKSVFYYFYFPPCQIR